MNQVNEDFGYMIYVTDTETTGLAEDSDIVEISSCRFDLLNPANRVQKTWYLKALNPDRITDEALAVNGHKREDILHLTKEGKEKYIHPKEVVPDIENWIMEDNVSIMDRVFAGQNPNFDVAVMKNLWKSVTFTDSFPFALESGNRIIDTKQLALMCDLCTGKRRQYYNLGNLVKSFKVKKRKSHKAEEDVAMTADLLINILCPIKELVKTIFIGNYDE